MEKKTMHLFFFPPYQWSYSYIHLYGIFFIAFLTAALANPLLFAPLQDH